MISVAAVEALLHSDSDMSFTTLVQVPPVDLRIYDGLLSSLTDQSQTESRAMEPSAADQFRQNVWKSF